MRRRDFAAVIAIAIGITALTGPGQPFGFRGQSLDVLVLLRNVFIPQQLDPSESPTVVIAIDEETYRRAPFQDTPRVMWTPQIGQVVEAVMEGGAKVIGFDIIFPTTVAGRLPGFDRSYLRTLRRYALDGRIILGKVQHQLKPITPFVGQSFAVGHGKNIRATNLFTDRDGVIRRIPLTFLVELSGGNEILEPSFAFDLAQRADENGSLQSGSDITSTAVINNLLLNFTDNQRSIPTYSFADLHACAEAGDSNFFEQNFAGRVVIIGAVLDTEDRKLTSMRMATAPDAAAFSDRCMLPPMPGLLSDDVSRDSIPGVYIHAFAVNNLLQADGLTEPRESVSNVILFSLSGLAALLFLVLPILVGVISILGIAVIWTGLATFVLSLDVVLPLLGGLVALPFVVASMSAYRFAVVDKDKRDLRRYFGLYLPASVIDDMVEKNSVPTLGGETREVTVMFSDLQGFTTYSEGKEPSEVVALLNEYLSEMTEGIEANGGFVDKFIGDAIIAVFGAPIGHPDHASQAMRAAIANETRLDELNTRLNLQGNQRIRHRVGINTGAAVVGNVGSQRRFNYTVLGDAVNVAARLEQICKVYQTTPIVGQETVRQTGGRFRFRRLDRISVSGRAAPLEIYTMAARNEADHAYGRALEAYLSGQFAEAAALFRDVPDDAPARIMANRCREMSVEPKSWIGYYVFD